MMDLRTVAEARRDRIKLVEALLIELTVARSMMDQRIVMYERELERHKRHDQAVRAEAEDG